MTVRAAVVVAAGTSERFGSDKMMMEIAGRPLVAHTVLALIDHVDSCALVCREDQVEELTAAGLDVRIVIGGATRTASEMAGLGAVDPGADLIGIHDGARPLASGHLIETLYTTAAEVGGAVPVLSSRATLIDKDTLDAVDARVVQTPQVFKGGVLVAAYGEAAKAGFVGHDTVDIVQSFSHLEIAAVPGETSNIKVTHPSDLEEVRQRLEGPSHSEPR